VTVTNAQDPIKPIHEYTFDDDNVTLGGSRLVDTGSKSTNIMDYADASNTDVVNEDGRIFRRFSGDNSNIEISDGDIPSKNISMKFDVRFPSGSGLKTNNIISSRDAINLSLEYSSLNLSIGDGINLNVNATKYLDGKWHTIVITYAGNFEANGVKMYVDDLVNPVAVGTEKSQNSNNGQSEDFTLGGGTFDLDNFQIYDKVLNQQNEQISK
ncbi:LamG-like jellyroll fold domain-containing protein, partial [Clostridium neuense]